jgi:hypothetical protein
MVSHSESVLKGLKCAITGANITKDLKCASVHVYERGIIAEDLKRENE